MSVVYLLNLSSLSLPGREGVLTMDTLTRHYDECDNFAFLEFVNEGVRGEVAEH